MARGGVMRVHFTFISYHQPVCRLQTQCRLNGQTVQSSNTEMMIFSVIEPLVHVTAGLTLEPGDVILMGTPSGVGHARKPPLWMKDGDLVEGEIAQIGVLRNIARDEV